MSATLEYLYEAQTRRDFPPVKLEELSATTTPLNDTAKIQAALLWAEPQITQLLQFTDNWDGYGGLSLKQECMSSAIQLLSYLKAFLNVPSPDVSLTPDGEVAFDWEDGERSLEIEVGTNEFVTFLYKDHSTKSTRSGAALKDDDLDSSFKLSLKLMFPQNW
jgi:hypothetical protein